MKKIGQILIEKSIITHEQLEEAVSMKKQDEFLGDVLIMLDYATEKEIIEALEDTNTSLISFKLNDIMRTLTIFSVIVFPLTLLAAIFGMNTVNGMPFVSSPHGFWEILAIMFIGAGFM